MAVALAAGIAAGRYGPVGDLAWAIWFAAAMAAGAVCLVRRWRPAAAVAAGAAIFAFGALHVRLAYYRLRGDDVATYVGRGRTLATVRGRVVGSASVYRDGESMSYPRPPMTRFDVSAEAIHVAGGWRPVRGLVEVAVEEEARHVVRGQRVELVGRVSRLRAPPNPGQVDRAAAGRRQGRLVECRVPTAGGVTVLAGESGGWARRVRDRAGNWARAHLSSSVRGRAGLLLEALLIGRRDPALRPLRETMVHAGIAHLLSISGMHLGMFLGFVYLLCRLLPLSPRRSAVAALVCLGGYLAIAEPRSPLLRSAVMASAVCAGAIFYRRHMALNALAVAAVALLVWDPLELFAAGFQLSFTIVAGLIVLTGPLRDLLFGRWIRERGLMVFRGERRVRRWLHFTGADWAMNAVAMSLLAWLLATPLVAVHFDLFSPYGAVLTLLAAPLVVATIVPGYVSLALAGVAPNLSHLLARAAGAVADTFAAGVAWCEPLPGLYFELRPVGGAWVVAAFACLLVAVLHRRLPWGRAWAVAAGAVVAVATVWSQQPAAPPAVAELDFLAVGGGQCAVLRAPGGRTWLLDAGSLGQERCGERVLVPFLRHRRLPAPEAAIVSHANTDHYNALPAVVRRGRLRRAYVNEYFGRDPNAAGAVPTAELLATLRQHDVEVVRLRPGRAIRLDERTAIEVFWPPAGRRDLSVNDTSLVVRVRCDDRSVLLAGDLEAVGQAAMAELGGRIRADVLVLPHHGSWEPTLPAFVRAVAPKVVVVSTGRPLAAPVRGGAAAAEFYGGLRTGRRVYSTLRDGWVRVRFGKRRMEVTTTWGGRAAAEPADEQ